MICQLCWTMQISAANLLIAAQQPQATPQAARSASSFVAALKTDAGTAVDAGFEAFPIRKRPAAEGTATPSQAPAQSPGGATALGLTLDIRV